MQREVPVEKIHVVTRSTEDNSCAALLSTCEDFSPLIPSRAKGAVFLSGAYQTLSPKFALLVCFVCPFSAAGKALNL